MPKQIILSQKQAHEFAKAIFADIATYIETHQKEYEEFLNTEESEVKKNDTVIKSS